MGFRMLFRNRLAFPFCVVSLLFIVSLFSNSDFVHYSKVLKVATLLQNASLSMVESEEYLATMSEEVEFHWCPSKEDDQDISINCDKIIDNDEDEIWNAKEWVSRCSFNDSEMMEVTADCETLRYNFPFYSEIHRAPADNEEYPLAFVVIGAKHSEQMVRLLQAIYHPRNLYCLTYDNKSAKEFKRTLESLDRCYDNIIMPKEFVNVYWGGYSILQTAMNCLRALNNHRRPWKYVQIVSWNDFPLRTNSELIKIFQTFNGGQDCDLMDSPTSRSRFFYVEHADVWPPNRKDPKRKHEVKHIPPGNLLEYKGSFATSMTREFIKFMFENEVAQQYYEWVNTTFCAEEIYWPTLIHNLHLKPPGGFPGSCLPYYNEFRKTKKYISRYQVWEWEHQCKGKITFWSCVFGVEDLSRLLGRPEIMAHKLYLDFEPALYYCLAKRHFNRTFYPEKNQPFKLDYYENMPAVRYSRQKNKDAFVC